MKIAVLSGKGGTGKTFVSVNLATVAQNSVYLDCDVEEPNGKLFFNPTIISTDSISVKIPVFDFEKCTGCRKCVDFCQFNALAFVKKPILFELICHSCGGCVLACPFGAITERDKPVGVIENGIHKDVKVHTGILKVGEISGVPIIRDLLKKQGKENEITVIDCPPGSACTVMESIEDVDYCVLVAEPTIFGIHNFNMVRNLVELLEKPFGVVVNKYETKENQMKKLCDENGYNMLYQIPFNKTIAQNNAVGMIASENNVEIKNIFEEILDSIRKEVLS